MYTLRSRRTIARQIISFIDQMKIVARHYIGIVKLLPLHRQSSALTAADT